jgi:hypothetical protein
MRIESVERAVSAALTVWMLFDPDSLGDRSNWEQLPLTRA